MHCDSPPPWSRWACPAPRLRPDRPLVPTPRNALGPFYPDAKPADSDADLTQVAGQPARAQGTLLHVSGRVLDARGTPVPKARDRGVAGQYVRALHASRAMATARVRSIRDSRATAAWPAAADGSYRFVTIKPPPYSGRTPHIHFIVASPRIKLTTQMFFEGEPLNERDFLYRNLDTAERGAATGRYVDRGAAMEPRSLAANWDIVLAGLTAAATAPVDSPSWPGPRGVRRNVDGNARGCSDTVIADR